MLKLEEYISRRKKENNVNEFKLEDKNENMRICVNYVFEYFNNYLNITVAEEKTVIQNEKEGVYANQLKEYSAEVREWLVNIYSEHGKCLNRYIGRILCENEFFFIYSTDIEFRGISYDCYSKLIKKLPFLKEKTEMLFLLIKDYHRVISKRSMENLDCFVSNEINEWIYSTWNRYQVNLLEFSHRWVENYWEDDSLWPSSYKIKSKDDYRKYEYCIRNNSDLFNINSLYRRMPKKSFTKGRKQEFEILMMYYWLHSIVGDNDGYWDEYLEKALIFLENNKKNLVK